MKTTFIKLMLSITVLFSASPLFAQLKLSPLFSDNMVLQQNSETPIWGKTTPQKAVKVTTSWNQKNYNIHSDQEGNWKVSVTTPSAGGPYEIEISDGHSITLKNVMIGEVWLCSGQSNMEMPLAGWGEILNYKEEIAHANFPNIRLFQVERATSPYPLEDMTVAGGNWQECSPATIPGFSATAYFFGRDLYENLNIPIGLIHTSWGGTAAESWVSAENLKTLPEFVEKVDEFSQLPKDTEAQRAVFELKTAKWYETVSEKDFGLVNNRATAAEISFDDSQWQTTSVPGYWEHNGLPDFDGFVWYRKTIEIPKTWEGENLTLSLGMIDDNDITWFNGTEVGKTDGFATERKYTISKKLVKAGRAVIAVRVMDTGGEGGFHGDPAQMYLATTGKKTEQITLSGNWKYKVAVDLKDVGQVPQFSTDSPHNPTTLYNAMIAPIVPYGIKGAIWYQGESNADRAYQYRTLFPLMISDWRIKWGYDFPFYFVQLANFMKQNDQPAASAWAELREAQLQTLHLQNTGMAVIIDIGDETDIHPKNKQDVGKRLALQARAKTYQQDITASGPVYKSYRIENEKIRICFEESQSALAVRGDKLLGFAVAGPDGKFHWANATIDGSDIIVNSPDVKFPIAARYAWADNPVCNLYNEAGLPASPFRTDDWAGVTINNR